MKVLLSGVNLVEGGPLKVFKDAITAFDSLDVQLYCLVNNKKLFSEFLSSDIEFLEFPEVKKSWLKRVLFEYFECKKISSQIRPDIWFSMHDMSPKLKGSINQFVYCHNPSPFYKAKLLDYRFDMTFSMFTNFYKWLYKVNIKSNKAVVVQQSWLSNYFKEEFDVNDVFIAKPSNIISSCKALKWDYKDQINLFYPALPRTFKNFEILLKAICHLERHNKELSKKLTLTLTIDESMCPYAKYLYDNYKHLKNVKFLGMQTREEVNNHYEKCDAVIFPSKLETWGLPITEAKEFNKPILLADLPYAHETLGTYHSAIFFDTEDYKSLANTFKKLILKSENMFLPAVFEEPKGISYSWIELANKILDKSKV